MVKCPRNNNGHFKTYMQVNIATGLILNISLDLSAVSLFILSS